LEAQRVRTARWLGIAALLGACCCAAGAATPLTREGRVLYEGGGITPAPPREAPDPAALGILKLEQVRGPELPKPVAVVQVQGGDVERLYNVMGALAPGLTSPAFDL